MKGTCIPAGESVNWCHHVGEQVGKLKNVRPLQPPPNSQPCAQEEMFKASL